ncbi:MAG: N-6 DNA methylase [Desulfobacterales bacterium]|nr:N-6 DNA methylase [Desulfobacterales bacterium]
MKTMINEYIEKINRRFQTGISTEHTFRGDLQTFLESFDSSVLVTNEPARIQCGAPDLIITKNKIPVGYIEAKDIGISLKKTEKDEQLKRYRESLDNLILTDYLEFRLYRNGDFVTFVTIAKEKNKKIVPIPDSFNDFETFITDFCTHTGQTIKSPSRLAEMMAGKAKMMQSVIEKAVTSDEENEQDSSLKDQMFAFRKILIHDIKPSEFADIYAQTIAYGMFAARLHDKTLDDFSRQEAAELIPKSNPFLRSLFAYIAGPDIDDRILWIVDALVDIFRATNVAELMKNFGSTTQKTDPVIHFYETFLAKYNPKLRKSRGVWYTPEPVVKFIVRAVDDILKSEFGISAGLADTSKIKINVHEQGIGKIKKEVHKVQILDPATGTGTFLAEVVKYIHEKFKGQQGIWSSYVEDHLVPRLNGFEILMASYTMAHLKLGLLLNETGFNPKKQERFRIFLTNSLEEADEDTLQINLPLSDII